MNRAFDFLPCSTDDLAPAKAALDDAVGDALRLLVGQQREQRHAPDEIEIGEHRHRGKPFWKRARRAAPRENISRPGGTLLSP
jgi:hypothetical protein